MIEATWPSAASRPRRIAVIGAGPIGLEAALHGVRSGHEVRVYERGRVAEHLLRWGHVRLFSPWEMNHSRAGADAIRREGHDLPADGTYLTGREHAERYLAPLARTAALRDRIHEHVEVAGIGRENLLKGDAIGGPRVTPFRLLLRHAAGESIAMADVVFDCSGVYSQANWLGHGGIPALGEQRLRRAIRYNLVDLLGAERERYAGRRVLLVGAGYSAATALSELLQIDGVEIVWVLRGHGDPPYTPIPDDPLPQRARLAALGNALAQGVDSRVDVRAGRVVERIDVQEGAFVVGLAGSHGDETLHVERILAHVGFHPDASIYRQLQVHECYATAGPMRLAALLLTGGSTDCLAQESPGPDALRNPEPDFFILGAKSFGSGSQFLMRLGLQQVLDVYALIDSQPAAPATASS